jgi:hypothetical protein
MEEALRYTLKICASIGLMMLSILFIDFGWLFPDHPLSWIRFIGYFLVGFFWNHAIITGEYFK